MGSYGFIEFFDGTNRLQELFINKVFVQYHDHHLKKQGMR